MIANVYKLKSFCKDYTKIENYKEALSSNKKYHCHHRLETHFSDGTKRLVFLKTDELKALGMYYNRPAKELIFLETSVHLNLHMDGKHNSGFGISYWDAFNDDKKQRISNKIKAKKHSALIKNVDTGETKPLKEWKKLGYTHCRDVCIGKRNYSKHNRFEFYKGEN